MQVGGYWSGIPRLNCLVILTQAQEEHDMERARTAMQYLAQYDAQADRLQQQSQDDNDVQECAQLRAEYYGIRAALVSCNLISLGSTC